MNSIFALLVAIVVFAGGGYYVLQNNGSTADGMMQKDTSVMDQAKEVTGAMMKKEETMAKDEGAMMEKTDGATMMKDEGTMMKAGSYEEYSPEKIVAVAAKGKVVLYFHADWCPICRALDADIKANLGKIPSDVTILKVNYDTSTALKQKYGVTYQHTLVQVNAEGSKINKWGDSFKLADVIAKVQ